VKNLQNSKRNRNGVMSSKLILIRNSLQFHIKRNFNMNGACSEETPFVDRLMQAYPGMKVANKPEVEKKVENHHQCKP